MIRAVAGSGFVRIAAMLASFGVGVQLARGLGVSGYGYYGLGLSILTIASIPSELGLSKLLTREAATAVSRKNDAALFGVMRWADRTCWLLSALIVVGILVAAFVLWSSRPTLAAALLFGIPTVPFMALSRMRGGVLQGLNYIIRGQIPANLLRPAIFSLLLALAYVVGIALSPASAMALGSITAGIVFVVAHIWLRNRLPPATLEQSPTSGRRWLASTIPLALTDGIRTLQSELTILLLGLLAIPADVGLFRIAVVTANIAAAPMAVLVRVSMPTIARLHAQSETIRLQKFVTYSAYAQTGGVVLLSLPLLIAPNLLLSLVFGKAFAGAGAALRIIALGQIANAAFGPNVVLLNMTHHERRVTRAMAIGLALNVVTVLLFVEAWGIAGGAVGFVVSLLSWNVLMWIDGKRLLAIDTSIVAPRPVAAGAEAC